MSFSYRHMSMQPLGHQVGQVIHNWLHNAADPQVRNRLLLPERLQLIRDLVALLAPLGYGGGLNWEDAQEVLQKATGVWIGRAQAIGPERAIQAAIQVWQSGLQIGPADRPAHELLLVVRTGREVELKIEELMAVIEAVQIRAGETCNVVFEYGLERSLTQELEVMLLVGYG